MIRIAQEKKFKIDWFEDHLVLTYEDGINVYDVMSAYEAIVADPRSDAARYFLFDFRACTAADYADSHYDINAAYSQTAWKILHSKTLRIGVIADNPVIQRQILELFARTNKYKHNWHRQLFETVEEARAWASEGVTD